MSKENIIIYNEDNIDLETNKDAIDYKFEVPQQKNIESKINAELIYIIPEKLQKNNTTNNLIKKLDTLLDEIQCKINEITDMQLLLEFKLLHSKTKFRKHNFRLLMLTVFLTFIEILYKQFDIINSSQLISGTTKNIVLLIPIMITSLITLLSAWIKSFKFEEVIENITRGIEKSITTKLKLGKISEDAVIIRKMNINDNDSEKKIDELIKIKYKTALNDYLETYTIADKNYTPKDLSKYLLDYLKTKKNEKDLELGKQKIQTQLEIDMKKIEIKQTKQEIYNKLKEYEYRKNVLILDYKLSNLDKGIVDDNDNDIMHMKEKKDNLYTKIKKLIKYLFNL